MLTRWYSAGESLSEREVKQMIEEADGDGDGEIDFHGE
jgi:Ca2+-binding EF-hand superfamily protein